MLFLSSIFESGWWLGLWPAFNTVALVATLIWIKKYTDATKDMASATDKMATLQGKELEFTKRPIVSIYCANEKRFIFVPLIQNISNAHAKVRVKATIEINENVIRIPEGHLYDGTCIWEIQAGGTNPPRLHGNMALLEGRKVYLRELENNQTFKASISFETRVINYLDENVKFSHDDSKNPPVKYIWKEIIGRDDLPDDGKWIPDISSQ